MIHENIVGKCQLLEKEVNSNLKPKGYRLEITMHIYVCEISYKIFDCLYDTERYVDLGTFEQFLSIPMTEIEEEINKVISDMDAERERGRLQRKLERMARNSIYGISSVEWDPYIPCKTKLMIAVPVVKKIIFNDPATIVFWHDGTKTVVKRTKGAKRDPEAAVAFAYMKKIFGSNHQFKKLVKKRYKEENK